MFLKDAFEEVYFEEKSADDNESINSTSVQRVITFRLIKLIHVSTCEFVELTYAGFQKIYSSVHKIKNKDEQTSKLKTKKKKNEILLDSNPHLLSGIH